MDHPCSLLLRAVRESGSRDETGKEFRNAKSLAF